MNLFNGKCRSFSSFQHQHWEALRRALISYSKDDFSEVGSAVSGSAATELKLMTEKPEPFVKTDPAGKASLSSFQYQGFEPLRREVLNFSSEDDFSELGPPVAGSAATQLKLVTEKPEPFVLQKPAKGTLRLYENSESSGKKFQNHPLYAVKKATIRIQGIGQETTDPMIHSICKSIGALEGIARADKDSVDALFRVTNGTDAQGLVQRLNNVVIDDCHWSAFQIPRDPSSTTLSVSEEVGSKLVLRINSSLAELEKQLGSKIIYFEDLQLLHMGIMHLEGLPTISNSFDED